jgi:NhaA family Na+:H+ antiporter
MAEQSGSGEALGGIVLIGATVLALIAANSGWAEAYQHLAHLPVSLGFGTAGISMSLTHWVNDALMAIFFLSVGLELKHEMVEGQLRNPSAVVLPGMAALGGMLVPALIYLGVTAGQGVSHGWAVPTATDIAFAVGVLALAGKGLPVGLRAFLLTLAILDDLGAILVIAAFYSGELQLAWLGWSLLPLGAMLVLMRAGFDRVAPILLLGVVLWVMVLQSGIHATLAGVVTAFCLPTRSRTGGHPLAGLQAALQPWVTFAIVPVFAFFNAGLPLGDLALEGPGGAIALGVGMGLLLGKFVGVLGAVWITHRFGVPLPRGVRWPHLGAAALLAGIGFTMSLFIGGLAFGEGAEMNAVRLGVFLASTVAAVMGLAWLRMLSGNRGQAAV